MLLRIFIFNIKNIINNKRNNYSYNNKKILNYYSIII